MMAYRLLIPIGAALVAPPMSAATDQPYVAWGPEWRIEAYLRHPVGGSYSGKIWIWSEGRLCAAALAIEASQTSADLTLFTPDASFCRVTARVRGRTLAIAPGPGLSCLLARARNCTYTSAPLTRTFALAAVRMSPLHACSPTAFEAETRGACVNGLVNRLPAA